MSANDPSPIRRLTNDDIKEIGFRLGDIGASLNAMHGLALDALCSDTHRAGQYIIAIREMARANAKGIDACGARLTGDSCAGYFASEFDPK